MGEINNKTVLVTGYAKAPQGTAMQQVYSYIGVILEIDPRTDKVIDAEFTLVTNVARRFFMSLMVGSDLNNLDEVIQEIRQRYIAPSREAMVNAIYTASQRYWETKAKKNLTE
ncbi:MAG: DUF3870 domain-containing protein [Bacillota bacterium]